MEVLFVLIPISIILIAVAIGIFGWAVKSGQYDDMEGPAHSILYDDDADMIPGPDDKPKPVEKKTDSKSNKSEQK